MAAGVRNVVTVIKTSDLPQAWILGHLDHRARSNISRGKYYRAEIQMNHIYRSYQKKAHISIEWATDTGDRA